MTTERASAGARSLAEEEGTRWDVHGPLDNFGPRTDSDNGGPAIQCTGPDAIPSHLIHSRSCTVNEYPPTDA